MTEPPRDANAVPDDPFAHCVDIAARNGSPLWLVGRSLPPAKRRFFAAAYASMRVIDDFVDDVFLQLSPEMRPQSRPDALARLDAWSNGIENAAGGGLAPAHAPDAPVFRALAEVLPRADLGTAPWQALAGAMRRDIEEQPLEDWAGFDRYCEGATVAPAIVFIYILGCRSEADGFRWQLAEPPSHYARDIAVFCYLVHILRDMAADADGDPQLLTIPHSALAAHGLSPEDLQSAIRHRRTAQVEGVARDLAARAQDHRMRAEQRLGELAHLLDADQLHLLMALYRAYTTVHAQIIERPDAVIADPEGLRRLQRATLQRALPQRS